MAVQQEENEKEVSMGMDYHMIRLSPRDPPHFFLPLLSASFPSSSSASLQLSHFSPFLLFQILSIELVLSGIKRIRDNKNGENVREIRGAKQQTICSRARELESQNLNFRSEFVRLDLAFEVMSQSEIESTIILDINLHVDFCCILFMG